MSFFPEIENGELKEDPIPKVYTPKQRHVGVNPDTELVRKDKFGTHFKDAPTMAAIHECVPNEESECLTCGRFMLI